MLLFYEQTLVSRCSHRNYCLADQIQDTKYPCKKGERLRKIIRKSDFLLPGWIFVSPLHSPFEILL